MKGKLLFLGTGGSMGIPVVACDCPVCRSDNPKNKRLRPSVLINYEGKRILIDAGPDFRQQALNYNVKEVDGVIFTHAHHDHTCGIDELRVFYMRTKKATPCLLSKATADDLKVRFAYMFDETHKMKLVSRLELQELEGERGEVEFLGLKMGFMSFEQGGMQVNGFRFGKLGFISDIKEYPETIFEDLAGVETFVLSALRWDPSPLHFGFDDAVAFAEKVGAKETWITHVAHETDHDATNAKLPDNIQLAYDGLEITFDGR